MKTIGRNDPCHCGSGRRYKECCGRHAPTSAGSAPALTEALQAALEHHRAGRLPQAEAIYRQVLQVEPNHPDALHFLGVVAHQVGKYEMAVGLIGKAIGLSPSSSMYCNMGLAFKAQGKLAEAVASYRKAVSIRPDHAEAHSNLGAALKEQGKLGAAAESYHTALSIKPGLAQAHNNLGNVLKEQGKVDAAVESYRKAISIKPDYAEAHSNLLFALSFHSRCSPEQYLTEARHYGSRVMAQAKPYSFSSVIPAGSRMQPLRVGLVSGDLRTHPVGFFLESILAHLNPARVELVAYSTQSREDDLTNRIKPCFAAWNSIAGLNDEAAARKIHDDGIHLLIDLAGHTAHNHLPVFAWKPAPVQVSWLGYFATTGVPAMDYLLADRISLPESHREHFIETVWYLPDTRLCFTPPAASAKLAPSSLPAMRNGYITFGCFQNLSKINDGVLDAWGRVFQVLPEARLRLQCKQMNCPATREDLLHRLARVRIVPERVTVGGPMRRAEYLAAHAEIDVILDTFPYPGGTTTCEALWMGVPTLTVAGQSLLARQGASLLTFAGLEDWIAGDEDDYVARTAAYATDLDRLAQLRSGLRQRVLASPLFDAPRFALHLEDTLHDMWRHKMSAALPCSQPGELRPAPGRGYA